MTAAKIYTDPKGEIRSSPLIHKKIIKVSTKDMFAENVHFQTSVLMIIYTSQSENIQDYHPTYASYISDCPKTKANVLREEEMTKRKVCYTNSDHFTPPRENQKATQTLALVSHVLADRKQNCNWIHAPDLFLVHAHGTCFSSAEKPPPL